MKHTNFSCHLYKVKGIITLLVEKHTWSLDYIKTITTTI